MTNVLLDTHAWAWSMMGNKRLSATAREAIDAADSVAVSAICLYEIGQKVMIGKWPEMTQRLPALAAIADDQGIKLLNVSAEVSLGAAVLDWKHRDPFDRIIAAVALNTQRTLISADMMFDELATLSNWPGRVW